MKITMVVPDRIVGVDGVFYEIPNLPNLLDLGVRAIQWDGVLGEIEWEDRTKQNTFFDNIDPYQSILNEWDVAHDRAMNPEVEEPTPLEEATRELRVSGVTQGYVLYAMLTNIYLSDDTALDDISEKLDEKADELGVTKKELLHQLLLRRPL